MYQEQTMLCDEFPPETTPHEMDSNECGLLFEQQYEKFGIINQNNDTDLINSQDDTSKTFSTRLQRSSVCSSSASGSSLLEGRTQQISPAFNSNLLPLNSFSSDPKDTSDSEKIDSVKAPPDNTYMVLNNEEHQVCRCFINEEHRTYCLLY